VENGKRKEKNRKSKPKQPVLLKEKNKQSPSIISHTSLVFNNLRQDEHRLARIQVVLV
jgi:hypothetical protein